MTWKQPQLADPPMGPTAEIRKLQHRLLYVFAKNSQSHELGVIESGVFDQATDKALRNIQTFLARTEDPKFNAQPGVLTYDLKLRLGVVVLPPKSPKKRFVQQGVGFSTDAFLMGDVTHSYQNALDEGTAETLKLAAPLVGVPKVLIGYSMGDDIVNHVLWNWWPDRRDELKVVVGIGPPSRNPGPTLLGNNPPGQGISGLFTPEWARGRTYQFVADGDMYGCAVGLLPQLYQILIRLEVSIEFAMFLFSQLTSGFGGQLLGLAGAAVPGFGALAPILGMLTGSGGGGLLGGFGGLLGGSQTAPVPGTNAAVLQPLSLLTMLPAIIPTLAAALKFVSTNAHYHYHDQPRPEWRGLTAVDCAAQIIAEKVPEAVVYTVPGTVSWWNDGPPAWTAWKLP